MKTKKTQSRGSLKRVVSWLASVWERRADGVCRQLYGDIVWWRLKRRVLQKYQRTRDPQIIRQWKWTLAQMEDEWGNGRLKMEVRNMIHELEAS